MLLLASVTPGDFTSLLTVMLLLASVTPGDLTSIASACDASTRISHSR